MAQDYEARIEKLVLEHSDATEKLQQQLEASVILVQETQKRAQADLAAMEEHYQKEMHTLNNVKASQQESEEMRELKESYEQQLATLREEQANHEPLALKVNWEVCGKMINVCGLKDQEIEKRNQEIEQLKSQLNEEKDVQEELRTLKIAYEKMVQVKDQEIKEAEGKVQENTTLPKVIKEFSRKKINSKNQFDDNKIHAVVIQHQKEIKVLQVQFQQLLDLKDKEIEGFAYRLKTVTASQQKDIEKLNDDFRQRFNILESECKAKEEVIRAKGHQIELITAEFEGSEVSVKIKCSRS